MNTDPEGHTGPPRRLAERLAEVSEDLLGERPGPLTVDLVVMRALDVVPGADGCGLTLVDRHGEPATVASTSELVRRADAAQYELGEGPCLDSATNDHAHVVADLRQRTHWPRWSAAAVDIGFRCVLSIPLRGDGGTTGALNVYSERPGSFDAEAAEVAEIYAVHAATALDQARLVQGLRTAMESRHAIGVAQGVLVARYGVSVDQAFEVLRRVSSHTNRKLRDVAAEVVATGSLPDPPGSGSPEDGAAARS